MPRRYGFRGVALVRHYVRKRTFSTAERVLVHLSAESLQPEDETQEGIAAATRSARSTLTKWLDRLERKGWVTRRRIRLPSRPLPKFGYKLTESGWEAATELRQRITSQVITVRAPKLEPMSVRLSELQRIASAHLDLTGALAHVRKGQLDLTRPSSGLRSWEARLKGGELRRVDRFFGRTQELRDLDAWWSSESRVLLVTGLAGIGKSALVAAWAQTRRFGVPVYGMRTRPAGTVAGVLSEVGAFLASIGRPAIATYLDQGVPLDPDFVARLLRRDLNNRPVLLIVDDADQASREVGNLIRGLFLDRRPPLPVKLVLVGRRVPRWMKGAPGGNAALRVLQIRGLEFRAAEDLLRSRGMMTGTPTVEEIIRKTRGHPLLLHLAASAGAGRITAVDGYLQEEVWDYLGARERLVLEAVSVFRTSVPERILLQVADADHRALDRLEERSLLERTVSGSYVVHDLVREFVRGRLQDPQRVRLHTRAAKLLLRSADSKERWEGVYHLMQAGLAAEAASFLESEGSPLLDCVAAEEITTLARHVTLEEEDPATYCVFAEVLGDSLRIRGHVEPAVFQYGHARRLAETSGHPERIPRLLRKMGFLERCRNRFPKALGYLVEAHARLQEPRNPTEMAEVLREMALAERASGDLDAAARHLNEAVDLATDTSDRAALSRTLLALGSLETQRGHLEQGLDLDLEGLRTAERSGNVTQIAHAHISVGTALIELGRPEESLKHFADGFAASRLLGNLRLMAYATMNQTSALLHLRRYEAARSWLSQSMGYFEILGEPDGVALLRTYEGEVEMGLGHWSRAQDAWRQGIALLRSQGSLAKLAHVLRDAAGFFARHGSARESEAYLVEARDIARRIGNLELASRIEEDLEPHRAAQLER